MIDTDLIEAFRFSDTTKDRLGQAGIRTVGDLLKRDGWRLCGIPGFGGPCVAEVITTLARHDMSLSRPSGPPPADLREAMDS